MAVTDLTQARDIVLGMFTAAWATLGTPPPIFYAEVSGDSPDSPYVEVSIRYKPQGQTTLAGADGRSRWGSEADLLLDIFVPAGGGMDKADAYIKVIQGAFRAKRAQPDEVWLRNVQIADMPRKGGFDRVRVVVNFSYDELA